MAKPYTQIYLHIVFAVSGRSCVIRPHRREELQKYIAGIGGVWCVFGFAFSSERWINYIHNQERHHRRKTFQEGYLAFLERHDVPYGERYVFKPVE